MLLQPRQLDEILQLVEVSYPDWAGFADPRFVQDEIAYKQDAVARAQELLGADEFQRLLDAGQIDELFGRLRKLANSTNLLFLGVPSSGDLSVLHKPGLDRRAWLSALFDLLHGPDDSPERLGRYVDHARAHHLPNKWTLPTYFLFLCHPEADLFIKPAATKSFLSLLGLSELWSPSPTPGAYADLLKLANELASSWRAYEPRDMVDIQSLIWIVARVMRRQPASTTLSSEFAALFDEFAATYLASPGGREHAASYTYLRQQARANYAAVTAAEARGEDITDRVLLTFLPHANTRANHDRGAWIHVAPTIQNELRTKYEKAGWTQPDDWPKVARAILHFVQRCVADPGQLDEACGEFASLPYTKGFQAGMLTPILNALRPDDYHLINNRSRAVLNYFAGTRFQAALTDYPAANAAMKDWLATVAGPMSRRAQTGASQADVFDMFSYWLTAVREYFAVAPDDVDGATDGTLAPPFSELFTDHDEADRAFEWMADAARRLGVDGPSDPRFSVTLWQASGGAHHFHFSFGHWLVLGFSGRNGMLTEVSLALDTLDAGAPPLRAEPFVTGENQPLVYSMSFTPGAVMLPDSPVQAAFADTLAHIKARFQDWRGTPYRRKSMPELARAIFDPDYRAELLRAGPIEHTLADRDIDMQPDEIVPAPDHVVSEQAEVAYAVEPILVVDEPPPRTNPIYPLAQCAEDTGFEIDTLIQWARAITRKKQAILYGPPGTGKTFVARALARHLIGGGDGFVDMVQFHPAYAYEDFVQGIRPHTRAGGLEYQLTPGRFLQFCERARSCRGLCVLIIDEINRANLSRVFGELMVLLEYRDHEIALAAGTRFRIPPNVLLIGTMNTADRSIALVDQALRRRFAFLAVYPDYDVLRRYHERLGTGFPVERLVALLQQLNQRIGDPDYAVGISFFMREDLADSLADVWQTEIEPYLEEHFYDQRDVVNKFRWSAIGKQIEL